MALTILAHPEPERIGDRVQLGELAGGRRARISRVEPLFAPPGGGAGEALGGRFLSRTPINLRKASQGALLVERGDSRISLAVDGVPLEDRLEIPAARLASGAAWVLADRIALWLHRVEVDEAENPPGIFGASTFGLPTFGLPTFGLVGESDAMRALRRRLARVADLDVPVLVRGPTGSGKELVARALHDRGPRPSGPFVAVNLGALTASLAVAELFGARKGAFTGALRDRPGHFARADGGTLFLDEVGEAPAELQVMLLRALETGEVWPVGAQHPVRPKVRLVSATDAKLEERVESGQFRAPLLHRLAGYRLDVPPLAARRDDLGRLLVHFLRLELDRVGNGAARSGEERLQPSLPAELVARMALYHWPGNVRELRNVVRELVIDSRGGEGWRISPRLDAQLPPWRPPASGRDQRPSTPPAPRRRRKPSEVSDEELLEALRTHRFDFTATAAALGISRTGLHSRAERCPLIRSAADLTPAEIRRAHEEHDGSLDAMVMALQVSERALRQRMRDLGLG